MEMQKITASDYIVDKILKENANLKLENAKLEFIAIQREQRIKELEAELEPAQAESEEKNVKDN